MRIEPFPAVRSGLFRRIVSGRSVRLGRVGLVGLLVWAAGSVAAAVALSWDVVAEPISLTAGDGTLIAATLYRPRVTPPDGLPAAVVVHGTAAGRRSCGPGLSVPLARQGFLTLAIDLPGHGRSGGSLPRVWFTDPYTTLRTNAAHPEIDAAADYLAGRPEYAGKPAPPLVLVGHSLGGWVVTDAGYDRADVRAVVSVGAAPERCDAARPRNFLIVTGGTDQLCPRERGLEVIARARGGAVIPPEAAFGRFEDGTDRRLLHVGRVNHFTEMADPKVTRAVAEWVSSAVARGARPEPLGWLPLVVGADLLATLGGLLAAVGAAAWVARRLPAANVSAAPVRYTRLAVLMGAVVGIVPLAAALGDWAEAGPVYFAAASVGLMTLAGAACFAVGAFAPSMPTAGPRLSARACVGAALFGMAGLVLAFGWLGVPWGMSWAELVPTPRRAALALALWPLLLPGCLGLTVGLGRVVGGGPGWRPRAVVVVAWLAVPLAMAAGHILVTAGWRPLFIVPVGWVGLSFLAPLPLWLLPSPPGMAVARAVCHAGAAAWLLGCHLPFVHG